MSGGWRMRASEVLLFTESRPFEPFRVYVADGRQLEARHPEMVMAGLHALVLWVLHESGEVEVVDAELVTSLKTLGRVDPREFMGPANREEG
jgi:hypothetical protein